jgi:AcrR family transcriptional regulator
MPRKLSNDRALRIVAAARLEFAGRGYAGARVDAIARAARVNKQLLFYYYHSKRGLYQAVWRQATTELQRALADLSAPTGLPLERLQAVLDRLFDYLADHQDLVSLLSRPAVRGEAGPFGAVVSRLVPIIAEGQGLGYVRDDLDPHLLAAQALVLQLGFLTLEPVVAASAPPLGADEPALRARWRDALGELILAACRE